MATTDKIQVIIEAQDKISKTLDEVSVKLNAVKASTDNVSKSGINLSSVFTKYLAPAAIGAGLLYIIKESADSEKAINSLKSAVEIAGGSWDEAGTAMQNYAKELQDTTVYSDEKTMAVMQRLITLTGESEKSWKNAGLALDIASSGLMDAEQAARAIAMALEGNVLALSRFIPELKGANAEILKNMTASQKSEYAMGLLQEKFGGRAQKEAGTFQGSMAQLNNQLSELAEGLGKEFIPALTEFVKTVNSGVKAVNGLLDAMDRYQRSTNLNINSTEEIKKRIEDLKAENEKLGAVFGWTAEMIEAHKNATGAMNAEMRAGKEVSDEVRKAQEQYGKNLFAISSLEKMLPQYHKEAQQSGLDSLTAQAKAQAEFQKKKETVLKEWQSKYDQAQRDENYSAKANLDQQWGYYYKFVDDKKSLTKWYYLELAKIEEDDAKKHIDKLQIKAGSDSAYFLQLLQQEQLSTIDKSKAWYAYQVEVEKVQTTIEAKNYQMVERMTSDFAYNFIEGIRTGNKSINDIFNDLVQDVIRTWERMIADMVAKWVASGLMNIITGGSGGGGGGGGGGGSSTNLGGTGAAIGGAIGGPVGAVVGGAIGTIADWLGLAEGGIVTKPTMAMIGEAGEPEAVIPLSKWDDMAGGSGTTVIFQTLLVDKITTEKAAKIIDRELNRLRKTDRSIFAKGGV